MENCVMAHRKASSVPSQPRLKDFYITNIETQITTKNNQLETGCCLFVKQKWPTQDGTCSYFLSFLLFFLFLLFYCSLSTQPNQLRLLSFLQSDGTIGGQEQKSLRQRVSDFIAGIIGFISLFFSAITNPPTAIAGRGANYAQRNNNNPYRSNGNGGGGGRGGGSNVRGVKNLQNPANAKMGGG